MSKLSFIKKYSVGLLLFLYMQLVASAINSPELVYPTNNAVLNDSSIMFTWSPVFYKTVTFNIQIAHDSNFTILHKDTVGLTSATFLDSTLASGITYYWRVRYKYNNIFYNWSKVRSFTIFTPSSISGLKIWLDPENGINTINGKINLWNDRSGYINNANQSDTSLSPTYILKDSLTNNKPTMNYDGVNDYFKITDNSSVDFYNYMSIHTLIKPKIAVSNLSIITKWDYQTNGAWAMQTSWNNNNQIDIFILNSPTDYGATYIRTQNANIQNNEYLFLNLVYNGTSSQSGRIKYYKNFNQLTQNVTGGIASTLLNSTADIKVGQFGGSLNRPFNGVMGEFIIYDQPLSTQQKNMVDQYFRFKYSPPVNLGPDTILLSNVVCQNITLKAQFHYKQYLWSTNASTPTITVNAPGKYWVNVIDQFGFSSSDTIIIYPPYDIGTPPLSNILCLNDTLAWITNFPKNKFTFQWQDNSTDSIYKISQNGSYYVKIKDFNNCILYSDTIHVFSDTFQNIASLGPDTNLCAGNSIYFKSGKSLVSSYLWSDGSTKDSLYILTTGQYSVTATSINGCLKKDTINIVIAGIAPTASFLFDTVCFGNANHFTDLSSPLPSVNTIVSRHWNFGDLNTLDTTATSFTHTYADTGSYSVKLTITTDVGCGAEKTQQIHVYPYPVISYSVTNLCSNAVVPFLGTAITFNYPIAQWNWNFGDPGSGINNTSASQNPTHNFASYGSYITQLIAKNAYGCSDTAIQTLYIAPSPSTSFGYSSACVNDVIQFTDFTPTSSLFNIQGYYWNFGDLTTSALQNPIHAFANNSIYTVKHIVTASNGCVDSMTISLNVRPKPIPAFTYSNACINNSTAFSDTSTIATSIISSRLWNFGDNTTSTIQNPQHTYTDTITARVKLVVTSNYGCKDSLTKTVYIRTSPTADFSVDPPYGSPPLQVTFTNNSTGATSYLWDFTDTVTTANSPRYIFTSIGSYSVTLTASTNFGCISTKSKTIEISKEYLDVAIQNLTADIQNNFLNISAQLLNNSSMDITSMDLIIKTSGIAELKEKWTGLLIKGGLMLYTFPTSMYTNDDEHFVCVTIENPNGLQDDVPDNNTSCNAVDATTFQILPIYPNPATDKLTIPLVIPEVGNTMNITLFNMQGKQIQQIYSGNINKGLQLLTVDLVGIASGMYSLKFEYKGQTIVKKFVKD